MKTPVLFMVFNRPDTTARVFETIRNAKPEKLFVAADGPRIDHPDDQAKCQKVRTITTQVDWKCEVKTLFREHNLGCGVAPAQNITWFFENVERGIILEDDCLPDPTFFSFCEEMLSYYEGNLLVGQITGDNFQHGKTTGNASYYFSKYFHICGWATWRSRWKDYSFEIKHADDIIREKVIEKKCISTSERNFWHTKIEMLRGGERKDVWDYQWMFVNWYLGRLSAVSNHNLISNIGYSAEATHTVVDNPKTANLPTVPIHKITHAQQVVENSVADHYTFFKSGAFFQPSLRDKLQWMVKRMVPSSLKAFLKSETNT